MTYTRLLLTWALLAVVMPINGIIREFGFKKVMRESTAEAMSAFSGIVLILAITRSLFRIPAETPTAQLATWSALLLTLTVLYEFGIGIAGGRSFAEMLENYAIWEGRLWPLVLVALAATPFLWRGR